MTTTLPTVRVLLAEDEDSYAALTASVLAGADWIQLVGRARDGVEAVALAGELSPDLVLMDVAMPELDGIAATARVVAAHPEVRVLVLSSAEPRSTAAQAAAAGAVGFVQKSRMALDLVEAISAAVSR